MYLIRLYITNQIYVSSLESHPILFPTSSVNLKTPSLKTLDKTTITRKDPTQAATENGKQSATRAGKSPSNP